MFQFSVTHHTLPVHDVRQFVPLKPASPNFIRTMTGNGDGNGLTTCTSISAGGIWSDSTPKLAMGMILRGDCPNQRGVCVPAPMTARPPLRGRTFVDSPGRCSPAKRSVTIQMKVWSRQLHRLKRKTDSLRKKDVEIKQRFQEIRRKAKRVISDTDLSLTESEDYATPEKRQKLTSAETEKKGKVIIEDSILTDKQEESRTNDIKIPRLALMTSEPPANQRLCMDDEPGTITTDEKCLSDTATGVSVDKMYLSHLLDVPTRRYKVAQRRHRSGSDIPLCTKENGDVLHPVPFPRTFLKKGKKCTNC